jgi:hypothetical protein
LLVVVGRLGRRPSILTLFFSSSSSFKTCVRQKLMIRVGYIALPDSLRHLKSSQAKGKEIYNQGRCFLLMGRLKKKKVAGAADSYRDRKKKSLYRR